MVNTPLPSGGIFHNEQHGKEEKIKQRGKAINRGILQECKAAVLQQLCRHSDSRVLCRHDYSKRKLHHQG